MQTKNARGFTLIELLVVIAIIAILAAILFPLFISAREAAKKTACIGNLRQVAAALAMYRDDYRGTNPYIWGGGGGVIGAPDAIDKNAFWFVLTEYMKQRLGKDAKNIVKCPSAPWLGQKWTFSSESIKVRYRTGFAYHINETGWFARDKSTRYLSLAYNPRDHVIKRPTQLIHIAEGMGWPFYGVGYYNGGEVDNESAPEDGGGNIGWDGQWPQANEPIPLNGDQAGPHGGTKCKIYNLRVSHRGAAVCLIYDGHVKAMATTTGRNWGNYY